MARLQARARVGDEARDARPGDDEPAERIDHQTAREIADRVAAHAVGDGPASELGLVEAGVFVDLADAAGVGTRGRRPAKLALTGHNACTVSFLLRASGETLMFEFAPVLRTSTDWNWLIIWLA